MALNTRPVVGDTQGVHSRGVLQPSAAPVDTYVRPAPKVLSGGAALLASLEELNSAFSPVLAKEIKQGAARQMAEGQELFEKNRKDFATAVKDGTIPPGASPFIRRGFRRSQLHVLGANYSIELNKALSASKVYEIGDPAQVEAFIQDFDSQFRERNGLGDLPMKEVNRYFTPMAVDAQDRFRQKQSALNIEYTGANAFKAFRAEGRAGLAAGRESGGAPSEKAAVAMDFATWAKLRGEELVSDGIPPEKVDEELIGAITEEATSMADMAMLGIMKMIPGTGGVALAATEMGKKAHKMAVGRIAAEEERRHNEARVLYETEMAMEEDELKSNIFLNADAGRWEDAERQVAILALSDPDKAFTYQNHIETRKNRQEDKTTEGAFREAVTAVQSSGSYKEAEFYVHGLIKEGLLSMADGNSALEIAKRKHGIGERNGVLDLQEGDKSFAAAVGSLDDIVSAADDYSKQDYLEPVARAKIALEDASILWLESNVNEDGAYDRLAYREFMNKEAVRLRGEVTSRVGAGAPPPSLTAAPEASTTGETPPPATTTTTTAPASDPPDPEEDPRGYFLWLFENETPAN